MKKTKPSVSGDLGSKNQAESRRAGASKFKGAKDVTPARMFKAARGK